MTDVVTHAEIKRTQQQLEQLKTDIAAARQEISDVRNVAAGSVIKSIQRGVIKIPVSISEVIVTVSKVDLSKSTLNFLGSGIYSPVELGYMISSILKLENETTIKAFRSFGGYSNGELVVSFELVEYV